ncbi:hypothetical protein Lalb_Chr08g0244401 [Lupinus albus]|uniref:Uncharacterized protein n=1 Tax=Lupinus albus TaxID=3870 RepID=A0A6A4Q5W9_LUPAL|nr:hypothetical protein Lalb_Chr08g0244401 [Lupinus albus]
MCCMTQERDKISKQVQEIDCITVHLVPNHKKNHNPNSNLLSLFDISVKLSGRSVMHCCKRR